MKKITSLVLFSLSVCVAVSSCKMSRMSAARRTNDILQSKENTSGCFVKMKNGDVRNFSTLKLKTGVFTVPYLLADKSIKIKAKDIVAYQNDDHYAISQIGFASGHKTFIGKEALPGFAIRIAKGKINVYTKKYYNGSRAINEYFVQKDGGEILAYTAETMNLMVKDDPEALEFFVEKRYTTPKSKKYPTMASFVAVDKKLKKIR